MGTDSFHLIFFSFDECARLRNKVWTEFRSLSIRGKERCMEDSMHLPGRRESKAVGVWGDNLRDLEGAFLSRGQFSTGEVDFQVTRVKPNLHSYFPRGKFRSNSFLDCLSGLSMGGSSLFSGSIEEFKSFVEGREERFPNRGVGSGFKTHHEREQHLVGYRVSSGVVRKLGHRQEVRPFGRLTLAKYAKVGFQFLVDPFRFTISLQMIGSRERNIIFE